MISDANSPALFFRDDGRSEIDQVEDKIVDDALFGKLLTSKTTHNALLFGLVSGFLYTIHPRAAPVLAAVLVYFLVLAVLKSVPLHLLLVSTSAIASVFAATRVVNLHLKAMGWSGGGEIAPTKLAGRLFVADKFAALIERISGQMLYLSLATHGLFLAAVVAIVWLVLKKSAAESSRQVLTDPVSGVPIFVLITGFSVLLGSSALKLYSLHGVSGIRGANFIHGRYNEAFAVLTLAFALAEYCRGGLRNRHLAWCVIIVIAAILCLTTVVMVEIDDTLRRKAAGSPGLETRTAIPPSRVDPIAVPAVSPLVRKAGALNLYLISSFVIATFLAITLTMRISKRVGIALVSLLFVSFSYYNYRHYLLSRVERAKPRLAFASHILRLGPIESISYDTAYRERGLLAGMQFLLPHTVFDRFDSRQGDKSRSEAVISANTWPEAERLEARFAYSSGGGSALWLLPGELQSRLPLPPYEGVTLGAEERPEFQESGFYRSRKIKGLFGRWTNGAATLRIYLDPQQPPKLLKVETAIPGHPGVRLRVLANGFELWDGRIPSHPWSRTLSLEPVPMNDELFLEFNSDTFSPSGSSEGSPSERRLGVVVTGIRLTAHETFED